MTSLEKRQPAPVRQCAFKSRSLGWTRSHALIGLELASPTEGGMNGIRTPGPDALGPSDASVRIRSASREAGAVACGGRKAEEHRQRAVQAAEIRRGDYTVCHRHWQAVCSNRCSSLPRRYMQALRWVGANDPSGPVRPFAFSASHRLVPACGCALAAARRNRSCIRICLSATYSSSGGAKPSKPRRSRSRHGRRTARASRRCRTCEAQPLYAHLMHAVAPL